MSQACIPSQKTGPPPGARQPRGDTSYRSGKTKVRIEWVIGSPGLKWKAVSHNGHLKRVLGGDKHGMEDIREQSSELIITVLGWIRQHGETEQAGLRKLQLRSEPGELNLEGFSFWKRVGPSADTHAVDPFLRGLQRCVVVLVQRRHVRAA